MFPWESTYSREPPVCRGRAAGWARWSRSGWGERNTASLEIPKLPGQGRKHRNEMMMPLRKAGVRSVAGFAFLLPVNNGHGIPVQYTVFFCGRPAGGPPYSPTPQRGFNLQAVPAFRRIRCTSTPGSGSCQNTFSDGSAGSKQNGILVQNRLALVDILIHQALVGLPAGLFGHFQGQPVPFTGVKPS